MKRFIDYGSIKQFRNVIRSVNHSARFTGLDDEGKPIYDNDIKLPTLTVTGTEKIHGTNMGVSFSHPDGFWVQSRKNIITSEKDNAGCAFNAYSKDDEWLEIIFALALKYDINLHQNIITVYAEWCGGNIQKNSAVSGLDKRAIVFEYFKVSPVNPDKDIPSKWLKTDVIDWKPYNKSNIFNITDFPTWKYTIDFEQPLLSQNQMIHDVGVLEGNSLVGQKMGIDGNVGEGIVFTFEYKDVIYRFKAKGEKHSASKVKTLKPVDEAFEQKKIDFVNRVCTPARLEQAWQETFGIENEKMLPDVKKTGDFLRAVHKDVIKEESDIMVEQGLEPKMVNGMISKVARKWFMIELDNYFLKG